MYEFRYYWYNFNDDSKGYVAIGTITFTVTQRQETYYYYLVGNKHALNYIGCKIFKEQTGKASCGTGNPGTGTIQTGLVKFTGEPISSPDYPDQKEWFPANYNTFTDNSGFKLDLSRVNDYPPNRRFSEPEAFEKGHYGHWRITNEYCEDNGNGYSDVLNWPCE